MKIKATLKKLKRGDILKINWIDAGDLDDSPSSWLSQEDAEKCSKRYQWKLSLSTLDTEKKIYFWSEIPKNRIFPLFIITGLVLSQLAVFVRW